MQINKKVLGNLERVYATTIMNLNGELNYIVASEGEKSCLAFNAKTLDSTEIWDGPGGTMNIIPVPGRENEFIATQKFLPTFDAKESQIAHAKVDKDGNWEVKVIMTIPYLHRFDLFTINDEVYFIGATLCTSKEFKEDWSNPGKVLVGKLSENITEPFELKPIYEGITKNHGFCAGIWNGRRTFLVTGVEGIFAFYVPENGDDKWQFEQVLHHEVSDCAICDIDGDGELELATIEAFHGDKGKIYKNIDGKLTVIHEYDYEFGHVVWGGQLAGKPSFIIAGRKGKMESVIFQMNDKGEIEETIFDNVGGASNMAVVNLEDKDVILAANRQIGEIAIYEVSK